MEKLPYLLAACLFRHRNVTRPGHVNVLMQGGRQFGGQTRRLLRTAPPAERERRQDGLARENIKSFMPQADPNYSDRITDIFALGSTFYHVMQGHDPFPDMDPFDDKEQIQLMFASRQFPEMESLPMSHATHKCWGGYITWGRRFCKIWDPTLHVCLNLTTTEPTPPLTDPSLPVPYYPVIELSRRPVEVIAKQQRPSIPLTPSPSLHLFPRSRRTKELQYWMKRSRRSSRSLPRDIREEAMHTRCAGRKLAVRKRARKCVGTAAAVRGTRPSST